MNLYLMRHCLAAIGARMDPARGLTNAGREQAEDMAVFMVRQIGRVDIVITSNFARAVQTAEIMGKALGAHVVTTTRLQPSVDPKESWAEIERIAQASGDVLVVGHHPDIGNLVDFLAGATGVSHSFKHGSIALVEPKPAVMNWLASHEMVARDRYVDAEEAAIIADALEIADAGLELAEALDRRSLQHPDHARILKPLYRKVRKLMASYFEDQGAAIIKAVEPWIKLHMKEAAVDRVDDDEADITAASILPDTLTPFTLTVSTEDASLYRDIITAAIEKAAAGLEAELNSGSSLPDTVMTRYLQQHSLGKLTGGLAETTKQRLRNAIAGTVKGGGTSAEIMDAITATVEDFSAKRAEMIAQTEVNNAYSFGRDGMARAAGLDEKNWVTESDNPCVVCIANEAEGWIPVNQDFSSGDEYPTAHPLCACGCDYRVRTQVLPVPASIAA